MADSEDHSLPATSLALRDILDYIAPGGTFLFAAFLFEWWLRYAAAHVPGLNEKIHTPVRTGIANIFPSAQSENWLASLLTVSLGIGIAYLLGHVVASVSAFLIERTFIFKAYGWPSRQLLEVVEDNEHERHISRCFYRSAFLWINSGLLVSYFVICVQCLKGPTELELGLQFVMRLVLLLVLFLGIGRMVSIYRKYWEARNNPSWVSRVHGTDRFRRLRDGIAEGTAAPYELCAGALSRILETRRAFDRPFVSRCREYFSFWFRTSPEEAGSNVFWLPYCFVLDKSPTFGAMLNHWRMQYAFARNLAAAFYMAFMWSASVLCLQRDILVAMPAYQLGVLCCIPLAYFALGTIMLIRYYYIFVCYYTKFVYRAFVYLNDEQHAAANTGLKRTAGAAA
jgi:hypothetical protein